MRETLSTFSLMRSTLPLNDADCLPGSVSLALAQARKPAKPSHNFVGPDQAIVLAWPGPGFWLGIFWAKPSQSSYGLDRQIMQ
jgi:hypothetical protein